MRARRGRSAEIAGVIAEEADHINGYCAILGFGWGIFWKEGVRGRLASGSCRARAERSRGVGITAGKKEMLGEVSLSAREVTCVRGERGDGERVCAVMGRTGRRGVARPCRAMQEGKEGGRPGPYGAWARLVWADGIGCYTRGSESRAVGPVGKMNKKTTG